MRPLSLVLAVALVFGVFAPAFAAEPLFKFDEFRGVPNPPVTIRDIPGGGAAWKLDRGDASLHADGRLKVEVRGLVLVNSNANPVPFFMATLSCLDAQGVTVNISTQPVPVGTDGDARFDEQLTLPETCLAPIVFVRAGLPTNTRWFAVSGF